VTFGKEVEREIEARSVAIPGRLALVIHLFKSNFSGIIVTVSTNELRKEVTSCPDRFFHERYTGLDEQGSN
jgi:hypothetical protein